MNCRSWFRSLFLVAAVAFALRAPAARAQDGVVISSPETGSGVSGLVEIRGTAVSQPFLRYELAFAYDPNPRGTWFAIGEPGAAPVVEGVLGQWDTTNVADGVYALRLRVYSGERDFTEFFVGRVVVRRDLPTPVPPSTEPAASEAPGTGPTPSGPTPTAIALPPPATPEAELLGGAGPNPVAPALAALSGDRLQAALIDGARFSAIAFGIMGAYAGVRWLWRRRRRK
ncbi:MAG: hypothetical protein JNL73_06385 [Anaerolineales bacterium]|nr:hypothetical protein [Anaerolineales bacterium]